MHYRRLFLSTAICLLSVQGQAQPSAGGPDAIRTALEENRITDADKMLQHDVAFWLKHNNLDTLITYIPLKAEITEKKDGTQAAIRVMYRFIDQLAGRQMTALQSVGAYRRAAFYCEGANAIKEAYRAMQKALVFAGRLDSRRSYYMAQCEYNLGKFAYVMANIAVSEKHHRRSLAIKLSDPGASHEAFYLSYNAIGFIEWHYSRYDSARRYYHKALEELAGMPGTNLNKNYRPALIKNNLVALYREEGRTSEALKTAYEVIDDYQHFLRGEGDDTRKRYAIEDWYAAIDNLAGIYEDIGDYKKQENLLLYAYGLKRQKLKENNPGIFISEILLGQYYNKVRDFTKARAYLLRGLSRLDETGGDYTFWKADAVYALALLYQNTDQPAEATKAYAESERLYEAAYGGAYDNVYMDFLRNKALFLASRHDYAGAVNTAQKIGDYLKAARKEHSSQGALYLLNLAEIHYRSGHYKRAVDYSDQVLAQQVETSRQGNNTLDSVRGAINKPRAILIGARAAYALQPEKDTVFLAGIYRRLDTALQILEKRKMFINDQESIHLLMAEHRELIDFFAKVALELYQKNAGEGYLEKFINIREGALYSRIRSRLNEEKAIRFSSVPESVLASEKLLKERVQQALEPAGADSGRLDRYLQAVRDWERHLVKMKDDYPGYYRLRYATLFYKLPELQDLIPENTTLVRYYMVDTGLVALVADRRHRKIVPLNASGLTEKINRIWQNAEGEQRQLSSLYGLYRQLWAPLAPDIHTPKVMVIPDGVLYNVSMDMLPEEPIARFDLLAGKSLLARHTFSYHYSLFMLEDRPGNAALPRNYIAFAPGFSDRLKNEYAGKVKDSLQLDRKYLTLLPQPASHRLTLKLQRLVGGKIFLDGSSTVSAFRQHAGNHKIVHIATHAEYNNVLPEKSGLFFAKDDQGTDDNFLSLHEVYDCRVNADLMILTACESGKPGYQDGEGLVSLAHAFNYAGSHNIITALWKIDEPSSAAIAEHFIHYLRQGLPTDEALRQAKLDYLRENDGRVLAPAYWSGLVLMGRPEVLDLGGSDSLFLWLILGTGLIISLIAVLKIRGARKKRR